MIRHCRPSHIATLLSALMLCIAAAFPPAFEDCKVLQRNFNGQLWAKCAEVNCAPLPGACVHHGGYLYDGYDWFLCDCNGLVAELCRGAFRSLGNGSDEVICFDNGCPTLTDCIEQVAGINWSDACLCEYPVI